MSAGGVFKLIANDGKADRMIMATSLINQRIKDITSARKRAGKTDSTPTLVDLERTHILFVNAHFKPFAAIGYEYNKVRPQSGNPSLGNSITFSIPQFGDFFHDMVGRQTLSSFHSSLQAVPTAGQAGFPRNNHDWDNSTALPHTTYSLVDAFGRECGTGEKFRNLVRYCEYPGERLYQSVKFDVNGNPLDEYTDSTINMLRKFTIGADKLVGYKRLVGQEVYREGFSGPKLCAGADSHNDGSQPFTTLSEGVPTVPQRSVTPVSLSMDTFVTQGFPDNAWDCSLGTPAINHTNPGGASSQGTSGYQAVVRECLWAVDGPQTPKYEQPQLEIWNKLRFWFNDDARLSIASVSIPFGQRFITIDLAAQQLLAFEFPGLYVRQVTDKKTSEETLYRTVSYRPWISPGSLSEITLSRMELYVNNIFVNPEIHDIFIKRIGFSLIRVYRQHRTSSNAVGHDCRLLSSLKWPIEYMFVGLRPAWNTSSQNPQQWRDWHRMSKVNDLICGDYNTIESGITEGKNAPGETFRASKVVPNSWVKDLKTVDTMSLTAHGINIHDAFPDVFFNAYVPFHYGGPAIVTPSDEGALMVNFALYPKSYQPSGHLNVSRAREFFLHWTTSYVNASSPADLLAIAVAINFLLITDGSAVLRYST
ncbi:major capsid protein p72 [Elysia marginata]|uniref:Major capsid protein p72 n=1 Tax=Elysia marginata TaxID=1093978 RepID=A0AAV4GRX7_9GAST|nr:major capsid protein p72 [Elysia marginata]